MLSAGSVHIESAGTRLVATLEIADGPWTRLRGLLGRRHLPRDRGMLIRPCASVHTWFMRFPIDVVFLDRDDRVVSIADNLAPFRAAACWRGRSALELAAGSVAQARLQIGDRLVNGSGREGAIAS